MTMTAINILIKEFNANNVDLGLWTESVFTRLCASTEYRWRFFNTLSYMEHIGSYKIMATQRGDDIDHSTLKHLNEETGHAVVFKRHAERQYNKKLDYSVDSLMAPASARAYFSRLEASMVKLFQRQVNYRMIYLYMSLIVEFRAIWGYEILQGCINNCGLDAPLEKLLAEEQGHLYSMLRRLEDDGNFKNEFVRELWLAERKLFVRLLSAIESSLEQQICEVA